MAMIERVDTRTGLVIKTDGERVVIARYLDEWGKEVPGPAGALRAVTDQDAEGKTLIVTLLDRERVPL